MKWIWQCSVAAALVMIVSADAFVGDKLSKTLGDLGSQLVMAVSLAGEVQIDIARPSADDLIKNKDWIRSRMRTLNEEMGAIYQTLLAMREHPTLWLEGLDQEKKAALLRLVPTELREAVERKNGIEMVVVLRIYSGIQAEVQREMESFDKALSQATESSNMEAVNRVGTTRGGLTASLGRLVEFSGRIQELAYVQKT